MMSIVEQFGGKRRKQHLEPMSGPTLPPIRTSFEDLSEEAKQYFGRVENLRLANEQMAAEIERLTKLVHRLEAEMDVAHTTLEAVKRERDHHLNYSVAVKTRLGTVGTLILEVLDAGNTANTTPPAAVQVDMAAMEAAVTSEDVDVTDSKPNLGAATR
jgi:hypothetical protein